MAAGAASSWDCMRSRRCSKFLFSSCTLLWLSLQACHDLHSVAAAAAGDAVRAPVPSKPWHMLVQVCGRKAARCCAGCVCYLKRISFESRVHRKLLVLAGQLQLFPPLGLQAVAQRVQRIPQRVCRLSVHTRDGRVHLREHLHLGCSLLLREQLHLQAVRLIGI